MSASSLARFLAQRFPAAGFQARSKLQTSSLRHSGSFVYRKSPPPPSKVTMFKANLVGFSLWYWILYNLWYDSSQLTGHFDVPDPSIWTDEELGIPPDEEG